MIFIRITLIFFHTVWTILKWWKKIVDANFNISLKLPWKMHAAGPIIIIPWLWQIVEISFHCHEHSIVRFQLLTFFFSWMFESHAATGFAISIKMVIISPTRNRRCEWMTECKRTKEWLTNRNEHKICTIHGEIN